MLGPIVNYHYSKELLVKVIGENHKLMFSKIFPVVFSVSDDARKTVEMVGESSRYYAIVGGTYLDHFIPVLFPIGNYIGDENQFVDKFILKSLKVSVETNLPKKGCRNKSCNIILSGNWRSSM